MNMQSDEHELAQRRRELAILERQIEAAWSNIESNRSSTLVGLGVCSFVAFIGGVALGAIAW